MNLEKRVEQLEKRLSALEGKADKNNDVCVKEFTLTIDLPEADIGGLHFNQQTVKSLFEFKDGAYYSKDILFYSARNLEDDTSMDILTEYLESPKVKMAFLSAYIASVQDGKAYCDDDIEVFLPEINQGCKKHNGARGWHWLRPASSAASFCNVNYYGNSTNGTASSAGGVAPAFYII